MQVAGGRRSRLPKSSHCSMNKNKQRKKKENESEIVLTNYWKNIKWLLWIGGCYLLLVVSY